MADVRRELQRVNPRKSSEPGGVPGRVLRGCADQLAEVFTSIFNLSLHLSAVPTCFKQASIIPIRKKPSITCLNDYRPVALTSTIMKCFERWSEATSALPFRTPWTPFSLHTAQTDQQMMPSPLQRTPLSPTWKRVLLCLPSSSLNSGAWVLKHPCATGSWTS